MKCAYVYQATGYHCMNTDVSLRVAPGHSSRILPCPFLYGWAEQLSAAAPFHRDVSALYRANH